MPVCSTIIDDIAFIEIRLIMADDDLKVIFQEYTRLRLNGLEAAEAVRALYTHLNKIDANMRAELARSMRAWENQRTEKIPFLEREQLKKASEAYTENHTVICKNCGKSNSAADVTCYSCGEPLTNLIKGTDLLSDKLSLDDAQLKVDSILHLIPKDAKLPPLLLRPQHGTGRMIIGRNEDKDSIIDVDLNPYKAIEKGVSRLHASLIYDKISETLMLFDMGSTNGTFINGQKLHPNERRALRQHDEILFGTLGFRIIYKDNSE